MQIPRPISDTGFQTQNRFPTCRANTDSIKKADIDLNMDSYYAHHYSIIYLFLRVDELTKDVLDVY